MTETDQKHERVRRVRVGLTGLAAIVVLVLLASVLFTLAPNTPSGGNKAAASGEEPLADMGLAPGSASNESGPANSAAPGPAALPPPDAPPPVSGVDSVPR